VFDPARKDAYGIKLVVPSLIAKIIDFLGVCLWGKKSVINGMGNIQQKWI
jgi:hypothetical protein